MINIAIIAALHKEIKKFNEEIKLTKKIQNKKYKINSGKFKKFNLISIISGIGKVSSAISTTLLIEQFSPEFIINIGTAGSLCKKLNVGDIIISKKNIYHDVDVTTFGYKYGQIPKNPAYFLSDKKLLNLAKKSAKKLKIKNKIGEICTGDCFIDNIEKKKKIKNFFPKAIAVDMESASISQVCYKFNIPFISIRIISDLSNKESKRLFKKSKNNNCNKIVFLVKNMLKNYS